MKRRLKRTVSLPSMQQVKKERVKIQTRKQFRKILRTIFEALVVVAALSVLIAIFYVSVLKVSGESMEPTLHDKDIILLTKTNKPHYGELIGFHYQNKVLLKRVIGLPGDYISIDEDGTVYVNEEKLEEPYVSEKAIGDCNIEFPYQVPEDSCFVMGDHRNTSVDSRNTEIGCIKYERLIGKVIVRIWPVERFAIMN